MSSFLETKEAYSGWLERLSIQYQQSQIKAAVSVNREMLTFYWLLGRDIISMRESSKWGSGFLETLSRDLRQRIPGAKCFSVTNLRYMEYFYTFFPARTETPPQVGDELNLPMLPIIHPQVGEDLFNIPWGHIKLIIDKCKQDSQKAKFYIQETVKNNWSRAVLCKTGSTPISMRVRAKQFQILHIRFPHHKAISHRQLQETRIISTLLNSRLHTMRGK